jgi:hypothetical protein
VPVVRPARAARLALVVALPALLPLLVAAPSHASRSRAPRDPSGVQRETADPLASRLGLRDERVLVLPFVSEEAAEPAWLSAGLAELVSEGVRLVGYRTVEPESRDALLLDLGLASAPRMSVASACVAGREAGARIVVTGSWSTDAGQGLRVKARALDVERVHLLREAEAAGPLSAAGPVLSRLLLGLTGEAGRAPEGRRQLERLLAAPCPALLAWMQAAGEPEIAEEHLVAALEVDGDFTPALLALAEHHLDAGEPEDVGRLLARMTAGASRSQQARARLLEGRAMLALGDLPAAVAQLDEAATLHPDREPLLWLAEAQLAAGDATAAAASARRALDVSPGDSHALDLLERAAARPSS